MSVVINTIVSGGGSGGGGGITSLTGDVTGSGTGAVTTTLAASGVTAGSYTNTNLTVNAKGLITAASNGSGGTTGQLLMYKKTSTATSPAAPQTRFEIGRVSVPANKIGINAKVTFYAVAGKVSGGAGNETLEMYVVPVGSTTFAPSTNRINTGTTTGTGVNAGGVFAGQVLGNGTDQTNLKFAGTATGPGFLSNAVSSQFVGLTAISPAVPTTAGVDFVITTTTTVDTTTVYDCWIKIEDPDAVASGGSSQATAWATATIPGVNTSPVLMSTATSANYYIPTPIDNVQKIYFSTITDGQEGEIILKGGAFQGNWPVFTTPWQQSTVYALGQLVVSAANNIYMVTTAGTSLGSGAGPTGTTTFSDNTVTWTYQSASPGVPGNMGWYFQQPGGSAPVADASTLNGTRIAYKARVIAGATCIDAVVQNVITLNP